MDGGAVSGRSSQASKVFDKLRRSFAAWETEPYSAPQGAAATQRLQKSKPKFSSGGAEQPLDLTGGKLPPVTPQRRSPGATKANDHMAALFVAAAAKGDAAGLQRMLDRGVASVELTEPRRGQTALIAAAAKGHRPVLELLLNRGAAAGATDFEGYGAIHHAAAGGHPAAVRLLLDRAGGLLPTERPSTVTEGAGRSAFELACSRASPKHVEVVAIILAHSRSNGRGGIAAAAIAACEQAAPDDASAARLRTVLQEQAGSPSTLVSQREL